MTLPISALQDDFSEGLDLTKWTNGPANAPGLMPTVVDGRLVLPLGVDEYNEIEATTIFPPYYDLTSGSLTLQVILPELDPGQIDIIGTPDGDAFTHFAGVNVTLGWNDDGRVDVPLWEGNSIAQFTWSVNDHDFEDGYPYSMYLASLFDAVIDNYSSVGPFRYPPGTYWWRFREDSGTLYFEDSPDRSTWSTLWSVPTKPWVAHVALDIISFPAAGVEMPVVYVDNINVVPGVNVAISSPSAEARATARIPELAVRSSAMIDAELHIAQPYAAYLADAQAYTVDLALE